MVRITRPVESVAVMTLDRPERRNSMAFDLMIPLRNEIEKVNRDNEIRVVILTGAGPAFCSGADLENPGRVPDIDGLTVPTIALRSMQLLDEIIKAIRELHQPVIAAVNGPAIGGGFCLALACDIRLAADAAYFRAAGVNNGLSAAELGLSYLLPRAIGWSRASELMLTGRDLSAEEAERVGLVSRCLAGEELIPESLAMATQITKLSRTGIELTKRMLRSSLDASSFAAHMDHEGISQLFVRLTTRNFEEAVTARKEGREPDFKS